MSSYDIKMTLSWKRRELELNFDKIFDLQCFRRFFPRSFSHHFLRPSSISAIQHKSVFLSEMELTKAIFNL